MEKVQRDIDWLNSSLYYFDLEGELKLTTLHPKILELVNPKPGMKILDFGCGDGSLTSELAASGATVFGVDKSFEVIRKARLDYSKRGNIQFEVVHPHDYRSVVDQGPFDAIVLSLVLITNPDTGDAEKIFSLIKTVLKTGGKIVLGETHPCFHNQVFSTFSTNLKMPEQYPGTGTPFDVEVFDSNHPDNSVVFVDYHRPLGNIVGLFFGANLVIHNLLELWDNIAGSPKNEALKSRLNNFAPAFLVIEGRLPISPEESRLKAKSDVRAK